MKNNFRKRVKNVILRIHDAAYLMVLTATFLIATARPTYAYVDPSVMTYTIQALAAVAVALSAVLGVAFRRSRKVIFRILRIDENVHKTVEGHVHKCDEKGVERANEIMRKNLSEEERRFRNYKEGRLKFSGRFFTALLVSFCTVYTVFVVAPLELVAQNASDLLFSLTDVFVPVMLAGLLLTLIVTLILSLFRGRVFNVGLAVVGGSGVAAYLQAVFMNHGLPLADGHDVIWGDFMPQMIFSGVVWLVLLGIGILFALRRARQARISALCIATALIIIQTVGVTSLWGPAIENYTNANAAAINDITTTRQGLYDVSPKKNVVVFVLDTTDSKFIEAIRNSYLPEAFDNLKGFTWYRNTVGSMIPTRYGVPSLLSNRRPDPDKNPSFNKYRETWLTESTFLDEINKLGYSCGIYSDSWDTGNPENSPWMRDRTINVHPLGVGNAERLDVFGSLRILYKAAFYRDAPWGMKPRFWYFTEDLNQRMQKKVEFGEADPATLPYTEDDVRYYEELKHYRLTAKDDKANDVGSFRFIHLMGSHYPWTLDRNLQPYDTDTLDALSREYEQTVGVFKIIDEYISDLKKLGLYENTTIIITADHGEWYLTPDDIQETSAPLIMVKPAQSAELDAQPMKVSDAPVWHYDIAPTILKAMGADSETVAEYGTPLEDVPADQPRKRYYYETLTKDGYDGDIKEFEIDGHELDFNNWHLTGRGWMS